MTQPSSPSAPEALQEALRERERYLHAILQTTADGFWVLDRQGQLIEVNDTYCLMSGYGREEIIGRHITVLDVIETPSDTAARVSRIIRNGFEIFETRHRRKDGTEFPIEVSSTYMPDHGGQFVCFGRDLTERKRTEERVALMAQMLDEAPAAITIHDASGRFLYANRATFALHGYDDGDEFLAVSLHQMDAPESAALIAERMRRIHSEGHARFEVMHFRRDGTTFPLDVLAKAIDWHGQPAVLSIAVDLSGRKAAEEALRQKSEELERYFTSSLDLLCIASTDGRFLRLNPEWERILGYSIPELEGSRFLDLVHPEDLPRTLAALDRLAGEEQILNFENRYRCKDGSYRWIEWRSLPQGGVIYAAARDITDRVLAEQERERLHERLSQAEKMESIGRLAGGVAHDFNNMLGAILGHTELALDGLTPGDPLYADLLEIRAAAERSADLTRQLLAFARRQTVAPRVLDLNTTVTGLLNMLRRLIGEGIDLVFVPGDDVGAVRIDPSQVDQILVNLCVNARDAIRDTGRITIATGARMADEAFCAAHPGASPGAYVTLTVRDTGCGMDADTRAHLFEPFFTTKPAGLGTGLGLATVYGIVQQNLGFITVDSDVGRGSAFTIHLPPHVGKASAASAADAAPAEPGHETILLVEDEPAILQMTATMLRRQGYRVLPAGTPGEAMRIAREHDSEIHLLVTDVIMPEMNGRDLAAGLLPLYPNLKRLFMSGYTADVIAHHGVLEPGIHFIQKPFSVRDLAARVRAALDHR